MLDGTYKSSKPSHHDLSIEGSNIFLSSLKLVLEAPQKLSFFDRLQIVAAWSRAQKNSTKVTDFLTRV